MGGSTVFPGGRWAGSYQQPHVCFRLSVAHYRDSIGPAIQGSAGPNTGQYAPRGCLTRWPGGSVRPEIPQPWADKAADHAAWVVLMQARLKRDRTNVVALARDMGVARSTLDLLMLGKSWPAFDVFTSMAKAMP